jgi:hypothetical protein
MAAMLISVPMRKPTEHCPTFSDRSKGKGADKRTNWIRVLSSCPGVKRLPASCLLPLYILFNLSIRKKGNNKNKYILQ